MDAMVHANRRALRPMAPADDEPTTPNLRDWIWLRP
jgi:hypothetical protein